MKFQDDISMPHTHTHTDKPKPICPPLFQSWGHINNVVFFHIKLCGNFRERLSKFWFKTWSQEGKFLVKNVVVGR